MKCCWDHSSSQSFGTSVRNALDMNTGDDLPTLVGVVTVDTASGEIMGPNPIAQMMDMHNSDSRMNLCWCEDFEQVLMQVVSEVKARLITRATPPMRFI